MAVNMVYEEGQTLKKYDDSIKDQYLTFNIDNEEYGVSIVYIKEIISICTITKVPGTQNFIEGIINLRGDIITVMDVRKRFLKNPKQYDNMTCIVVIEYQEYSLGLIVDSVNEVLFIYEEDILSYPSTNLKFPNKFVKNIGKIEERVVLLLDINKILGK